jgi:hypothetical protein
LPGNSRLPGRDLTELEKALPWFKHAALCVCVALSACADFPEVATTEGPAAPPPPLLPLDGLVPEPLAQTDPAPALTARADALRARAAAVGAP